MLASCGICSPIAVQTDNCRGGKAVCFGLQQARPGKHVACPYQGTRQFACIGPDLQVVVAFRMMPRILWSLPSYGTINLHASLLPQYRGAAPINWAIINGETTTGLTTFFINETIDTGNVILQEKIEIGDLTNAGELHDIMKEKGADLLVRTVHLIGTGNIKTTDQVELSEAGSELKHAPKIHTPDCRIDWTKDSRDVHNLIRGLSPYPGSFTFLDQESRKKVKIFDSRPTKKVPNEIPGTISVRDNSLQVACADATLEILSLQMEGKRKMSAQEFINGLQETEGLRFVGSDD